MDNLTLTIIIVAIIIIILLFYLLFEKYKDHKQNKTIVTAFFDIGRDKWNRHVRTLSEYLNDAVKNLSLDENMVIFIEEPLANFVKEHRKDFPNKTHIIVIKKENLPKYYLRNKIKEIMDSPEFKKDLADPTIPEMWNPDYVLIMWSKTDLIEKAIDLDPFRSTHFCWLDFGMRDYSQTIKFPKIFNDKIKFLCRSMPEESDLDRIKMCKSHINRFAGTFFTGRKDYMLDFIKEVDKEIERCIKLNVVDNDQTIFSNVFLQNKNKFDLYFGDWHHLITRYSDKF
ncbi:MAG: hypothetical protein Satyrvirus41_2 [Satyrvirus sp.]|uniref:Uncharacterized protein n=1 Tax=Satyrvirus sp. TaxID=2487771 RepID=A0A3G5AF32_9VIRU|nr:MAG: hypothetical protein Satyrvirus41_2 [Satyrvirus sp.]